MRAPNFCTTPAIVRAEKFFTRVADPESCWIWRGSRSTYGYGMVSGCREDGHRHLMAHRVLYEAEVGPIPEGMQLDHFYCDNGKGGCVRPSHCRPVSQRENLLRSESMAARNAAKTHCPKGHEYTEENTLPKGDWRECKTCKYEKIKAYKDANPEKARAAVRSWVARNRERHNAKARERSVRRKALMVSSPELIAVPSHCKKGHVMTDENTRMYGGVVKCVICYRETVRRNSAAFYKRKRERLAAARAAGASP